MPFECLDFFAIEIPQFDGVVFTTSGNRLAVGTKGNAPDTIAIIATLFEWLKFFAFEIP